MRTIDIAEAQRCHYLWWSYHWAWNVLLHVKHNWSCAIRSIKHDCRERSLNWIVHSFFHILRQNLFAFLLLDRTELKQGLCNKSQLRYLVSKSVVCGINIMCSLNVFSMDLLYLCSFHAWNALLNLFPLFSLIMRFNCEMYLTSTSNKQLNNHYSLLESHFISPSDTD